MPLPSQSIITVSASNEAQKTAVLNWLITQEQQLLQQNTSFINETLETISIDTVRDLQKELTYTIARTEKRVIVILASELLTLAAQNALLKILEEPPINTYIILATNSTQALLPTIQSRCNVVFLESSSPVITSEFSKLYDEILTYSHGQIIEFVDKQSTKEEAVTFIHDLIHFLHSNISIDISNNLKISKDVLLFQNTSKNILMLLKYRDRLQKNGNVKLHLSEALFELKSAMLEIE